MVLAAADDGQSAKVYFFIFIIINLHYYIVAHYSRFTSSRGDQHRF